MLGRIILIIVAVAVALFLLRRALGATKRADAPRAPADTAKGDLVACAHCGVNLPVSEARSAGGRHYCSEEHWRLGPRDG
jgi:uncharacterized protein